MARSLNVKITGDASSYQRALRAAGKDTSHLQKGFHALGVAAKVGLGAGLLAVGFAAKSATKELIDAQKVTAQTNAVLKSTGQAANVTAKHVEALGTALLRKSGIDDEAVKTGENMLLTFKKIRNESGAGNKIFDQATRALVDMDVAMTHGNSTSESLSKTAIRLGKALNDPVKGATALKRVGVDLDEAQKKQIATFVKSGDVMSAQKVILKELTSEFGGSAAALGTTFAGKINILRESLRNLGADLLSKLIPTLTRLSTWLVGIGLPAVEKFARGINFKAIFQELRPAIQEAIAGLKGFVGVVDSIRQTLGRDLFAGMIVGIVGAAGALEAIHKMHAALLSLSALGLGTGVMAVAFLAIAVTIGGLTAAFLHNRDAANKVSDSYKAAANAAKDLKTSEDTLKQSELDVEQAHIRQAQATDAVVEAQKLYNQTLHDLGPKAQQTIEALHNLQQAKHDQKQADVDAKSATEAYNKSLSGHVQAQRNVADTVVRAAHAQRDYQNILAATASKIPIVGKHMVESFQTASQKAEIFSDRMSKAARSASRLSPEIATAYRAVAALARAIQSVPSDLTIRFIVRTLTSPTAGELGIAGRRRGNAAGGRIPGARVNADSVPAMLSPGEFVVTGGGERMLESMTFPGVLNWLGGKQPRHFAGGGRATKRIEYDRLYQAPMGGGMTSAKGLVPQVLRALAFARTHGWGGSVISGFRTYAQQLAIWNSGVRPAARPGTSSHERGQAVDVSDASSFDTLMNQAPLGSQLFNLVPGDFNHFSVSGYAVGGRVAGPGGSVTRPGLGPTPAPTPLAGLRKRIRALRAEERQLKSKIATVDAQIRQIDKTKKKSKAQIARRKDLAAESGRLHARLKSVQAQLVSLNQRVQEVVQHDYSELPISLQLEAAQAALTETTADDATALAHAQAYLESQLRRPGITKAQRVQLLRALAGVRGDLANLGGDTGGGGAGDTGAAPVDTADLEAQLAQANARATYSAESARLANAFVSTGVFAGARTGAGLPGTPTIVFNNLIPDADQIRRATEAIATGAGAQAYRPSSFVPTGY